MIKRHQKLITLVSALFVFAVVLFAGYIFTSNKISVSFTNGIHIYTKNIEEKKTCLDKAKISENKNECLFIGCNGFF
jgi:hypothetical protein